MIEGLSKKLPGGFAGNGAGVRRRKSE